MDVISTLTLTTSLACIALFIASAEYLVINREFGNDGAFSWRVFGSRPHRINNEWLFHRIDFLFGRRGNLLLQWTRLALCVLTFCALATKHSPAAGIVALLVLSLINSFRGLVGADGSDQMTVVILSGLGVAYLVHDPVVQQLCIAFIGAQGILSYLVAGVAKLVSSKWRDGTALRDIMNTRTYGHATIARTLLNGSRFLNLLLCWQVIAFETAFGAAVFLPRPFLWMFLLWGALFHLFNAILMGLNTFFWAFIATYPCMLFLSGLVHQ